MSRWTREFRKGSTRLAILLLLGERERYGYEIIETIAQRTEGVLELAEGNVYPALHALEAEGHIKSVWREVEAGVPPRKYYKLTASGREHRATLRAEWKEHVAAMDALMEGT